MKVFVSGCFDILHAGHVRFFEDARALGDSLTVCVPSDDAIRQEKGRIPALREQDRITLVGSMRCVDRVVLGRDPAPLNFVSVFDGDVLAATEDDRHAGEKRAFCATVGAQYVSLPKTPASGTSTTEARRRVATPASVPLRIDLAGGWLDVPRLARPGGYIVNVSITPEVSLHEWPYQKRAGLGGSAAYSLLSGRDPLASEAALGVGWQDPAVIAETGLCVWESGLTPKLVLKRDPSMLAGHMGLHWTGEPHDTPGLVDAPRDYCLISAAGHAAMLAAEANSYRKMCNAVNMSYAAQINEGMPELPTFGEVAKKYCGGGWGGYAVYLFASRDVPDHMMRVEPCIR